MLTTSGRELVIRSFSTARTLPDGRIVWDGVGIDVTAERRANDNLAYLMSHDPLTGLKNRVAFELRVAEAIAGLTIRSDRLALFTIEIEDLAEISDALGPATADGLLQALARRLSAFANPGGEVARIGDSKFSISTVLSADGVSTVAAMLRDELGRTFRIEGRKPGAGDLFPRDRRANFEPGPPSTIVIRGRGGTPIRGPLPACRDP
jgi:GGDEF domain-containing protein